MNRKEVIAFAEEELNTLPDYPFVKSPQHAVLRHRRSGKWFGILLVVERNKLGLSGEGTVDVLNVKCDPELVPVLRSQPGIVSAYHMNRYHWVSILLDGTVVKEEVENLLMASFHLTR